jgi:hypothetical protein
MLAGNAFNHPELKKRITMAKVYLSCYEAEPFWKPIEALYRVAQIPQ